MRSTVLGLIYGLVLGALALLAAGAGHGTRLLMSISSAPLGLWGAFEAAFGPPLLWAAIGALSHRANRVVRRRQVVIGLTVHYFGVVVVVATFPRGDWDYLVGSMPGLAGVISVWGVAYAAGQIAIWRHIRPSRVLDRRGPRSTQAAL